MKNLFKYIIKPFLFLILILCILLIYAHFVEPSLLVKTTYTVQAPSDVKECKIVYFSDTHLGNLYDQEHLSRIVEKINSQNTDIVVFGGDLLDNYARDQEILDLDFIKSKLKAITPDSKKYAVYGNHDYGGGASRVYSDLMENGGFTLLNNTSLYLEEFNIRMTGFDDYLLGNTDPELYQSREDAFTVLLSHEPDVAQLISMPQAGLMLSGHSHGGQVTLPFLTQYSLPTGATKYIKGHYPDCGISENLSLYVSKGIGMTVLPFRFLNPPEIMVLQIRN